MKYVLSLLIVLSAAAVATAGYRETFEKEFLSKPWAGGPIVEKSACIECHTSDMMKASFRGIPDEWQGSWHALNEVSCHDCHGGDPKDPSMAMSHVRGFVGKPNYEDVPEFCGKCHIGIMKNYLESGHGRALKATRKGPNCVTCHGSHGIQRASIDIINEQLCTRCHSYERAKTMKQALFLTEKRMGEIGKELNELRGEGIFVGDEEKTLFSTQAEFRALFHTVDVSLVKKSTDEFTKRLDGIEKNVRKTSAELRIRRNFSAFLTFVFAGLAIIVGMLARTYKDKD
ncbi:MAG: cytochrome C [Nitrospirae bacterium]|nr:cytochrome C [Nitrospirota bacterium]